MAQQTATLQLGKKAPDFKLLDAVTKDFYRYEQIRGKRGTIIMFLANHCPYVQLVAKELSRLANDYRILGFGFAAISSNDAEQYPADSFENMRFFARDYDFTFPYLYDESQEIAKAYAAQCTPDFFIFNAEDELVYHGQLDDARPGNGLAVNGRNVRETLDNLYYNRRLSTQQKPGVGCSIKWKEN